MAEGKFRIVLDYDGTLTNEDIGASIKKDPNQTREEINAQIMKFTPKSGLDVLISLDAEFYIVTGRREHMRVSSERWLEKHKVPYKEMIMLPDTYYKSGFDWEAYNKYKVSEIVALGPDIALEDRAYTAHLLEDAGVITGIVKDSLVPAIWDAIIRWRNK